MAKRTKLDEKYHVIRDIGARKYRKDGDEFIFFPAAFRLRLKSTSLPPRKEDEKYISASWLEYFDGSHLERAKKILIAIKKYRKVGKNAALVTLNVGKIIACGKKLDENLTAWHEPKNEKPAYAAIRGMQIKHQENDRLPTLILAEAVANAFIVSDLK